MIKNQSYSTLFHMVVAVCETLLEINSDYLPFCEIRNSGIGNYHGEFGFLCFTQQKSVMEKTTWGEST